VANVNMNIHSSKDVSFQVGYFKKGEDVQNAGVGTKFKNWLAGTSFGKNILKMDPPKCMCVRDANTGRHIATDITTARFGNFVKVDLSGNQPSKVRNYTPPPSTKGLSLEDRGSGPTNVDKVHGRVKNDQELQTAKKEIAEGFGKEFWNRDQMTVALYGMMTRRDDKGGPEICPFVVGFDPQNPKTSEFGKMLDGLKQSIKSGEIEEGQRFQVAVQDGAHWTAIDAKIINGEPHFFVMDAAQSPTVSGLTEEITQAFPKCTIYEFNDKDVKQLQFDDNSCSRFTLDHLSVMSKDDQLFERLGQNQNQFRNIDKSGGKDFMVSSNNLPAGVFRMLQSHSTLDKVSDEIKDGVSSPTKQKTSYQQALSHTVVDFDKGKIMNTMVDAKKDSFAQKSTDFLDGLTMDQFNHMMTVRKGEGVLF